MEELNGLLDKLYQGVVKGEIQQPFTTSDFNEWMNHYRITKDDGTLYSESSKRNLSNWAKKNVGSSNKNKKILRTSLNAHGKQNYWFDGIEE